MNYRMGKAAAGDKVARQHGAMEYTEAPTDLNAVRHYRLGRLRDEMRKRDVAGLLLFDQINTRYATDATNMQVWCSHYETRCVFVALEGPVVLFDYANHPFLAEGLPTVDEYRVMPTFYYFASGPNAEDDARRFGDEIADLMADVREWGIAALHKAIEGLTCTTAVHICYGYGIDANIAWKRTLGGEWRQYEEIFPALNQSRLRQVSLECANSRVPMELIGLLKDKDVLVGAIDVASNAVETPDQVAATIRTAAKYVSPERIYPCTNCGMAPMPREVAAGKLQALAAGAALARKSF